MKEEPAIRKTTGNRNPDGTFPKGVSGNPSGRPKGTLKDYIRQKLCDMTPAEKEEFLKTIPTEVQWKMGEGNPTNEIAGELNLKVSKLEEIQEATKTILNG
jgi:hypothetical protein